ncbi:hypothetical protein [Paracoccus sp. (in: a-proteobacteria)]|uniref:hypothetical protein n=1 Tax=Paracoccus sp. TaxID=267 RepID=UPI00321FCDF5
MIKSSGVGTFIFDIHFETALADAAEVTRRIGNKPISVTKDRACFCWHPTGRRRGDDETIVWELSALLGGIWFRIDWDHSTY